MFTFLGDLFKQLKKLDMNTLNFCDSDSGTSDWAEKLIKSTFCAQLYLEKAKKKGTGNEVVYEFLMGPRAKIEIGRIAILNHIAHVRFSF